MIKIGIDSNRLLNDKRGVRRYLFELLDHFPKISHEYQFRLFYNSININFRKNIFIPSEGNIKNYFYAFPSLLLHYSWNLFSFPKIESLLGNIHLFHSPEFYLLPPSKSPIIVTIHDLAPLKFKDHTPTKYLKNYIKSLIKIEKKASGIILVSEHTLKDVKHYISLKNIKFKIIPNGVVNKFRPITDKILIEKVKKKYHIKNDYFLYVGGASINKNLDIIIEAYSKLPYIIQNKYDIIIAGAIDSLFEKLIDFINKSHVKKNIKLIGYVSENDLPVLYSAAKLFLFPSLYEGFGMAPLEAMACGTPVLSSYKTSLKEVLNGAAIEIDPFDSEDIKEKILLLLEDQKIQQEKIKKGFIQSKKYTWENTAKMTLNFYKEIISR